MRDLTIEELDRLEHEARTSPSRSYGRSPVEVPTDKLLALVEIARRALAPPAAVPGLVFGEPDIDPPNCAEPHGGYRCTLLQGHAGDHVGHDIMERVVAQWPSDNAARLKGGE